jgi:alkanesulfonate monooxygenase SsuD/methylene tetrahydromethanopterin reductase-like flavin-dependent oxidoreductase (luciferase family)
MRLALRYDLRHPEVAAASLDDLYAASIEQCEWGDRHGFDVVYLGEHHGAEDSYLASPIVHAAAIASRTERIEIHFSALVAVLHHPLRLAEDLATLDIISRGRVAVTLGIGYRPHEYAMFGVDKARRISLLEEIVDVLELAWTGEPFEFRGTTVSVRPTPVQRRPPLYIGGSTPQSAIRAAHLGDNFFPATPELTEIYEAERRRLGLPLPAPPPRKGPMFTFITDNPDRDWQILAPHLLYASNIYYQWSLERGAGATPYPPAQTLDDLRSSPVFAVVTPDEFVNLARSFGRDTEFTFQPLMGGIPPKMARQSLELFAADVLPELERIGYRTPAVHTT